MSPPFCPNPIVLQQLYTGPLGAYIDPFAPQLLTQGYASWTAKYPMRLLADLSRWLQRQTLAGTDLNAQRIDDFLPDRSRCYRVHRDDHSTLHRWLAHLRDQGVIPVRVVQTHTEPHDRIACDFEHSLLHQRALAPSTVPHSLDTVRRFLCARFNTQPLRLEALGPQDIPDFMVQQSHRYSPARTPLLATALRSFFRFLLQRGAMATDLARAVPTGPTWRLSSLPRCMKAEDVDSLLHSCDRRPPKGQRDFAIVLLFARLGLRAGAVGALPVDDLKWDAGELVVRGKGARHARLPLPHEVGEAFALSLRHGRPPSATRQVFVRRRAPRRGLRDGCAITTIVHRAIMRAGRNPTRKGAPLLRHSLATQLLQSGASLTEIGERLRHQDIETTRISAKVDQAT